jgi:hypothetical protein
VPQQIVVHELTNSKEPSDTSVDLVIMCIKELQANIEVIQSQMDKITKKVVSCPLLQKCTSKEEIAVPSDNFRIDSVRQHDQVI